MRYQLRRNLPSIDPLVPAEPGLRAHLLRVAALAVFAAERIGWTAEALETLEAVAMLHHRPLELLESEIFTRDLFLSAGLTVPIPEEILRPIRIYRGLDPADESHASRVAAFVESANLFDEQIENLPYEDLPTAQSVQDLLASGLLDPDFVRGIQAFRAVSKTDIKELIKKLPVFPTAALRALNLAKDANTGMRDIERVISTDPVLAGEIVQVANSGFFGRGSSVSSLAAALARLGTITACKLISAAALRPLMASAGLQNLWLHSVETAESAVLIAAEASGIDVSEAYLAGLVHDIGRLALSISSVAAQTQMWTEIGFPVTYAEVLVAGNDHGDLAGEILDCWNFPESIVAAVRCHHRPELTSSPMAAVLHLAENSDESLPSCARDHLSSKRIEETTRSAGRPARFALRAG